MDTTGQVALRRDVDGVERAQGPAMYAIASAMLDLTSDVQRTLGLRPDACRVYRLIAVSAVRRHARASDAAHMGADPLPTGPTGLLDRLARRSAGLTNALTRLEVLVPAARRR